MCPLGAGTKQSVWILSTMSVEMRNEAEVDNFLDELLKATNQSSLKSNKLAKNQKILNSTISCFVGYEDYHSNIFLTEGIYNSEMHHKLVK